MEELMMKMFAPDSRRNGPRKQRRNVPSEPPKKSPDVEAARPRRRNRVGKNDLPSTSPERLEDPTQLDTLLEKDTDDISSNFDEAEEEEAEDEEEGKLAQFQSEGIPGVDLYGMSSAKNWWEFCVWGLILIFLTALTVYGLYLVISRYLGDPASTDVEFLYPSTMHFPNVSVRLPLNILEYKNFRASPDWISRYSDEEWARVQRQIRELYTSFERKEQFVDYMTNCYEFLPDEKCIDEERECAWMEARKCRAPGSYHGEKNTTYTGKNCLNWTMTELDLGDHNQCRNPDGRYSGPWCYEVSQTEDNPTQLCFPDCSDVCVNEKSDCVRIWSTACKGNSSYEGTKAVSVSGKPCLNWAQLPENRTDIFADFEEDHNFCRNPFGLSSSPACFITETELERCFADCIRKERVPMEWEGLTLLGAEYLLCLRETELQGSQAKCSNNLLLRNAAVYEAMDELRKTLDTSGISLNLTGLDAKIKCQLCQMFKLSFVIYQKSKLDEEPDGILIQCEKIAELSTLSHGSLKFSLDLNKLGIVWADGDEVKVSYDLSSMYPKVDWSWQEARESWRSALKVQVGHQSINDMSRFSRPGRANLYDVKIVNAYQMDTGIHCEYEGERFCRYRCVGKAIASHCGHRCIPFTWESFLKKEEDWDKYAGLPHCSEGDYEHCLNISDIRTRAANCEENCIKFCYYEQHQIEYVGRRYKGPSYMFYKTRTDLPKSQVAFVLRLRRVLYPKFTIKPAVEWYNVLAEVGGVIGLWLGISVAGIIHFCWFILYECPKARKAKGEEDEQDE